MTPHSCGRITLSRKREGTGLPPADSATTRARNAVSLLAIVLLAAVCSASAGPVPTDSTGFAKFLYVVNGPRTGTRFRSPSSLAVDQANNLVYVCDSEDRVVYAFSLQGALRFTIGQKAELDDPVAVAVDRTGNLYVSERKTRKVKVFDTQNKLSDVIDLEGVEPSVKAQPGRLTVTRDGEILVVDQANQQVLVFGKDKRLSLKFGKVGDRLGEFRTIEDVAADRQGRIYVVDSSGTPIQVFDRKGGYITRVGTRTDLDTGLVQPVALVADRFEQLWLVDSAEHNVKIFDRIGLLLRVFGEYGMVEKSLFYPIDIDLDGFGRLYVLERGSRRLQVFELSSPAQPMARP